MNTKELRKSIINRLRTAGIAEASAISAVLLMHGLKIDKTRLIIGEYVPSREQAELIERWVERAESGEPVQYIVGESEFMSLKFKIRDGVLIPRADTEILVSAVLGKVKDKKMYDVWDLCCGSGCIGISLAHYAENLTVTLADISDTALRVSAENIKAHNLESRTKVIRFDVLSDEMPYEADGIVSNPPYIARGTINSLDRGVRCFEPKIALDGGDDGLDFYRRIASFAKIKKGGFLAFEIGFDQKESVAGILKSENYRDIKTMNDIENRPRVVIGTK